MWKNIAYSWWVETDGSDNKEDVEQNLCIDGIIIHGNPVDLGTDTSFLLGTISARLSDLNSGTSTPIFHIGTKIFEPVTDRASFMATIDDLVVYNGTSSVTGNPKRFASSFGTSVFERGEPYQDYNLNFRRDTSGRRFEDKNGNGVYDAGEAFDMGGLTFYDSSGEFYSFYGERFIDAGTSTLANAYENGELYIDYNRNRKWDSGELYLDLDMDQNHNQGVSPGIRDSNNDGRLDDSGYIVRNFTKIVPVGNRIGTIAWTEYLPEKTDVSLELTLKALDGKILWRWFGGDGASTGTRIDLPVPEDAVLEYQANLFAVGAQTESPVLDDITVTVIKKMPEILSLIE